MRKILLCCAVMIALLAHSDDRVQIRIDSSEAEAVLAILAKHKAGQPIAEADWQRLFSSEPYVRLKQRETSFKREFTDEKFREFVLSPALAAKTEELQRTLAEWKGANLTSISDRMLAYLPPEARIRATVYPVIKPRENSFVWELSSNPAIFLYLDPSRSREQFENTTAHELHHVGLQSVDKQYQQRISPLPEKARTVAGWMGAFGEGMAVLAAAGSPEVHPHSTNSAQARQRWDEDSARFDSDLAAVEAFFTETISGKLASEDTVSERGMSFFGTTQGPWYTVGYRMASEVERRYGRAALISCMQDPRRLLATWNVIARQIAASGAIRPATWSPELLEAVGAEPLPNPPVAAQR